MMTSSEILSEVERQEAELILLGNHRLGLRGGDTALRAAIDHHLPLLLWLLSLPESDPLRQRWTAEPADPPPVQPPPSGPIRLCGDCTHYRPRRCAARDIVINRNRRRQCSSFEEATL